MLMMVITLLSYASIGFVENGAPIYTNLDNNTAYTSANDENIALVKMIKPNYTEEYEIQFFRDFFVVVWVSADVESRSQALQSEVGVKQEYGPNPRVNSVKKALDANNLFQRSLANDYVKPTFLPDEAAVKKLLKRVINTTRPELANKWNAKLINHYSPEYHGSKYTYIYVASKDGNEFAKYKIDESGWVEISTREKNGEYNFAKVYQLGADGNLYLMVPDNQGVYVPVR